MKTVRIPVAASLLLLAAPAFAAGGLAGFERDFDAIDRDGNGYLSWREFENRVNEMFFFADLDSDGYLDRREAPAGILRRWERIDTDRDGRISLPEFVAEHRAMFLAADSDGDGRLSRAEVDALPSPRQRARGRW